MAKEFYAYAERIEHIQGSTLCIFDTISKNDHEQYVRASRNSEGPSFPEYMSSTLEVQLSRDTQNRNRSSALPQENAWYKITTSENSTNSAILYNDIAESDAYHFNIETPTWIDLRSEIGRELRSTYSMDQLTSSPISLIKTDHSYRPFCKAICHNVGQGSCASLWLDCRPQIFIDFGCGRGSQLSSADSNIKRFFAQQPIILTHWHTDHFSLALKNPNALDSRWIVPHGKYGPSGHKLASQLSARGHLHILVQSGWHRVLDHLNIYKLNSGSHPHNSGLAIVSSTNCWRGGLGRIMFPGDAPYRLIPRQHDITGLVATHHGSNKSNGANIGLPPKANGTKHVVYSFGYKNRYKHPSPLTLAQNLNQGWINQSNTLHGDIDIKGCPFDDCDYPCMTKYRCCR